MADIQEISIDSNVYDIKAKSIVNQNGGALKYWTGTKTQYEAIATKDATTLYFLSDVGKIYFGDTLISNNSNGKNIGELVYSSLPQTDAGLHLLDGALISGSGSYSDFVDYIADLYTANPTANYFTDETTWQNTVTQYGVCGKFVYNNVTYYAWYYKNHATVYTTSITLGDTVTLYSIENGYVTNLGKTAEIQEREGFDTITIHDATGWYARNSNKDEIIKNVRLPKVTGIIEGTTDVSVLGDLVQAGLPNITGNFRSDERGWVPTGVFSISSTASEALSAGTSTNMDWINFDASRSSSIYGNSSTVQPQTIKCFVYIVIANSTKTDIQVDIDEIATDLNGKADTDLSNTTDQAKILMSGMGMPSDKYINLTLGASGATYTAPANGYYNIGRVTDGQNPQYVDLVNTTTGFFVSQNNEISSVIRLNAPVRKGDVLRINYTAVGGSSDFFRFYYAQGSESEAN